MIYDDFSLVQYNKEIKEDTTEMINNLAGEYDWGDDILLYPNLDSDTRNIVIKEIESDFLAYA